MEPGMWRFFSPSAISKKHTIKSIFEILSSTSNFGYCLENRLWGREKAATSYVASQTHTRSGVIIKYAQIYDYKMYNSIGWETSLFTDKKSSWWRFSFLVATSEHLFPFVPDFIVYFLEYKGRRRQEGPTVMVEASSHQHSLCIESSPVPNHLRPGATL